jgi:hypothetical protein
MDLNKQVLAALSSGMDHDSLLDLVHGFIARGMTPRDAYDGLQDIWLGFGYDASDEESESRDNLEYVMEKVWYECPSAPRSRPSA